MGKLRYIQELLGTKMLAFKAKAVKRDKKAQNLETAKTIGILFNAKTQEDHKKVVEFASKFVNQHNIKVEALGYVTNKELISAFQGQSGFLYITDEDFNWRGTARNNIISNFVQTKFSIFIDLTLDNSYTFDYIASLSKADFRVGRYIDNKMPYDLMIDIKKDNSLDYLIKQILIYLSMIKVSK